MNRRCAVGTLIPVEGGRGRYAQPLVNTNTTAVTQLVRPPVKSHRPEAWSLNSGTSGFTISQVSKSAFGPV